MNGCCPDGHNSLLAPVQVEHNAYQGWNREFWLKQTAQENCCRYKSALTFTGGCTIAPDSSKYFSLQTSIISRSINNSF